ncbi:bacterial extracellular solute-binding s, 3 family protein, partial [Vibrio harveyi]
FLSLQNANCSLIFLILSTKPISRLR